MGLFPWQMEGDGTLKGNSLNVTPSIKLSTIAHPLMGAEGNSYSQGTPRAPLLPAIGGDTGDTPLKILVSRDLPLAVHNDIKKTRMTVLGLKVNKFLQVDKFKNLLLIKLETLHIHSCCYVCYGCPHLFCTLLCLLFPFITVCSHFLSTFPAYGTMELVGFWSE